MTIYFADSNAVAKRYVTEEGSIWVRKWAEPSAGNIIVLSDIAHVEVQRVILKHRHENNLDIRASFRLRRDYLSHAESQYIVIEIDETIRELAVRLIRKHQVIGKRLIRSLDALQLACAVRAVDAFGPALSFVTSDEKFKPPIEAEGFSVVDPKTL